MTWGGHHRAASVLPLTERFPWRCLLLLLCPSRAVGSVLGTRVRAGQGVPEGTACLLLRERQAQWSWARPRCCRAQLCVLRWERGRGMGCESVHRELLQAAGTWGWAGSAWLGLLPCSKPLQTSERYWGQGVQPGQRGRKPSQLSAFTASMEAPRVGLFSAGCCSSPISKP